MNDHGLPRDGGQAVSAKGGHANAIAALGACWLALLVFLWPGEHVLWAGALSSASFILAPIVFRRAGGKGVTVSPRNWLWFGFGLQLVVMPLFVRVAGPSQFLLDAMPSRSSINLALLLDTVAFWAFCAAFHSFSADRFRPGPRNGSKASWVPGRMLCSVFVVMGMGGLLLKFGSLGHLVTYLTDPLEFLSSALEDSPESASLNEAAGTFLSAFLGFGCVLFWCRTVDRRDGGEGPLRGLQRSALIAAIALSYAMMSYNRGSVAVPMVALAAAVSKGLPGAALRYLAVTAAILAVVLTSLTLYRSLNSEEAADHSSVSLLEAGSYIDAMGTFQVYGQAPQFLAAALAQDGFLPAPRLGRTLVSSILSPLPVVGKPFRESSGAMLYNQALGRGDSPDQIPQFVYELFRDFHIFGVVAGFAALGSLVALLQLRFERASTALEAYILQYAAVWLGFLTVGSIDALAQIAIYSAPPIYVFLWSRRQALEPASSSRNFSRTATGLSQVRGGGPLP